MAEEKTKAEEKKKTVVILNRGERTYHVHTGKVLKEAKGDQPAELETVALLPNGSIEVGEKQAKELLGYPDLIDAAKAAPAYANKLEALTDENAKLKAELAEAKKQKDEKGKDK